MAIYAPQNIIERIQELNDIVVENPENIPIPVAAKFLHMHPDSLRSSINHAVCDILAENTEWQQRF